MPGDEVITAANTFVATVGAINEIGAIPIFVDVDETFCMNTKLIESAITERTRAIVPVHFSGYMTNMEHTMNIADKHNLIVVEDACQAILAEWKGKKSGTWGNASAFSLHPLKNLNVWSDGGMIVTDNKELDAKLRLLRNHGLVDRNHVAELGYNSRLDTFQAIVGSWLLPKAYEISLKRIENARLLDEGLGQIEQIRIPDRPPSQRIVYHLYMVHAKSRDELLSYCQNHGVEAKVHYPIPIYKQRALDAFTRGQVFPVTDSQATSLISFPCDQHLTKKDILEIIDTVKSFYKQNVN